MKVFRRAQPDGYLLVAVGLGMVLCQPLLAPGLPRAPDAALHYYRAVLWRAAWDQGVFWPRWDTLLYQGYGYPLFNFYAPLLYLASVMASYASGSVEAGLKVVLALSCLAYATGMYLWARDILGPHGAIVAAAAYAFAAFRFRELYFLGGYAQFLAWALYPWILFFFYRLAARRQPRYFVGAALSLAALLLAHNISAMLFLLVFGPYALGLMIAFRRERAWLVLPAAGLCGAALATVFWLPALAEASYTHVQALTTGIWDVAANFIHLQDLYAGTPPLDSRAVNPPLPFTFGRLPLALAALGALTLFLPATGLEGLGRLARAIPRKLAAPDGQQGHGPRGQASAMTAALRSSLPGNGRRAYRCHVAFALIGLLVGSFLMLPGSLPIWRAVPLLRYTEYPWRVFGPALLLSALLAGASLSWLNPWPGPRSVAAAAAALALIVSLGAYQFPRPFLTLPPTEGGYLAFETAFRSIGTTAAGEYLSRWTPAAPPQPAESPDLVRAPLYQPGPGQHAAVEAVAPQSLRLHVSQPAAGDVTLAQFYFPGWRGWIDGAPAALWPAPGSGLIQLAVPAGDHDIAVVFGDTPVRAAARDVSLVALPLTAFLALALAGRGRVPGWQRVRWAFGVRPKQDSALTPPAPSTVWASRSHSWPGAGALLAALALLLAAKALWIGPHTSWFRLASPAGIALPAQHASGGSIAGQVALLGYDLDQHRVTQGSELHITLYWQALRPLARDYSSYVHLVGGPGGQSFAASDHQHPGNVPASTWPTTSYVVDDHYVRLPADAPPVPAHLDVGLYVAGGQRLGSIALPDLVYIAAAHPLAARDVPPGTRASFGPGIELLGERVSPEGDGTSVTLFWRPGQAVGADYQVFVHLLDADGRLIGQADGPPVSGLYPMSLWCAGEIISDTHHMAGPGRPASVQVGLYDLSTLQRLPATDQYGRRLPDDAVVFKAGQ